MEYFQSYGLTFWLEIGTAASARIPDVAATKN
jgi:hypothetical protein